MQGWFLKPVIEDLEHLMDASEDEGLQIDS